MWAEPETDSEADQRAADTHIQMHVKTTPHAKAYIPLKKKRLFSVRLVPTSNLLRWLSSYNDGKN